MAKFMKQLMAAELREALEGVDNMFVVGLGPMTAEDNFAFRNELRSMGARFRIIQNRTARYALGEAREALADQFKGQTALALLPGEDPDLVNVAKAVMGAVKKKQIEVRGGWIDGEVIDGEGVKLISNSPDKQTLRGMLCGAILGPGRGLAVAIQGLGSGLARCLDQRAGDAAPE